MVRNAAKVTRWAAALGLLAACLSAGCVGVGKRGWAPWGDSSAEVGKLETLWLNDVQYIPDPTRGNTPTPALVGRLYLFHDDKLGQPLTGDGKVTIELYDDAPTEGGGSKLFETTVFGPDVLAGLANRDRIGMGYSLIVPGRADLKMVHLTVKYEPKSGAPVMAFSGPLALKHAHAAAPVQQAAVKVNQ